MIQLYVCTLSFCVPCAPSSDQLAGGPRPGLEKSSETCGFLPSNFGPKFCFLPASDYAQLRG